MRIEIFGQSGSGKSHGVKILIEEFLKWQIPFVVIDPEGEYISFKEIAKVIIVGGEFQDIPLNEDVFSIVLEYLFKENLNLVFDLSEIIGFEKRYQLSAEIQESIFNLATKYRKLFVYVVDEAKLVAPQKYPTESNQIAAEIAQRGRKRGFIPIFALQRPSEVDKAILTQCNIHLIGRLQYPTDLNYVKDILKDADIKFDEVKKLSQEFFLIETKGVQKIKFRSLKVKDLGRTVQPDTFSKLQFMKDESIDEIITKITSYLEEKELRKEQNKEQISELTKILKEKEIIIETLKKELDIEKQTKEIASRINSYVTKTENYNLQDDIDVSKKQINESRNNIKVYAPIKGYQFVSDEKNLLQLNIQGINFKTGRIVGSDFSKLIFEKLDFNDRKLFFVMQDRKILNKTSILKLIPEISALKIDQSLRRLMKYGLIKRIKKGKRNFYRVRKMNEIS